MFEHRLIKTILSKEGVLHFRRWRVFEHELLSLYVHCISKSDAERDPHDHPWWFASLVLWGGYREKVWRNGKVTEHVRRPGQVAVHGTADFHKITLLKKESWSLVLIGPLTHELWGYWVDGTWIDNVTYRLLKHQKQQVLA